MRCMCSQGLGPAWEHLHSSITGKCSTALNNHVCLCAGMLNWTLGSTAGLLIKQGVLCSVEQSNKGKIAFSQKYLKLSNVLQHCENWSGIGKEGYMCVSFKRICLQRAFDKWLHSWKAKQRGMFIVAYGLLHRSWSFYLSFYERHFCAEASPENVF